MILPHVPKVTVLHPRSFIFFLAYVMGIRKFILYVLCQSLKVDSTLI